MNIYHGNGIHGMLYFCWGPKYFSTIDVFNQPINKNSLSSNTSNHSDSFNQLRHWGGKNVRGGESSLCAQGGEAESSHACFCMCINAACSSHFGLSLFQY